MSTAQPRPYTHDHGPTTPHVDPHTGESHGTFGSYSLGFIVSVILTAASFAAVMSGVLPKTVVVPTILALAVVQMLVHVYFFLHLDFTSEKRWNLVAFVFAAGVLVILVFGSLWIMWNINHAMMPTVPMTPNQAMDSGG